MSFTIRPAVREKIGLLFGIAGASGSGKTYSALCLANGIANGHGKIAVIDTEAGRALHYAPKPGEKADPAKGTFDFLHLDFAPPFEPMRYIEAIRACEEAGATVIVIDSMSHEWNGEGGCSDMQAVEAERMARAAATKFGGGWESQIERMTAPAWKRPKMQHKRMMSRLLQTRTHLIFCLRAEEKIKIVNKKVEPAGFMPICEKGFMFEMSGSMTMHPETPGEPRYDLPRKLNDQLQAVFREGSRVTAQQGAELRLWADGGAETKAPDKGAEVARGIIERVQDADGMVALELITSDEKVAAQRNWMREKRPDLAVIIDDAVSAALAIFSARDEDQIEGEAT